MFKIFTSRFKKKDLPDKKTPEELTRLLANSMSSADVLEWESAAKSSIRLLNSIIKTSLKTDNTIELLISGASYLVNKDTVRKTRIVSKPKHLDNRDLTITIYTLEISLKNPKDKNTDLTLIITNENVNGLFLVTKDTKVDISGIIPQTSTFKTMLKLYEVINKSEEKNLQHETIDNIIYLKPKHRGNLQ